MSINSTKTKLKKELGFTDITLATVGYIVGAGIYAVIGLASKYGQQYTWLSVLICGILAICTGLSYSELSSMFNKNGGEYFYAKEAFNDKIAKVVAYFIIITEVLTLNAISLGLGNYISTLVKIRPVIIAAGALIAFGFINYIGIRESANYNNIATVLEVSGLILISFLGFKNITSDTFDLSKFKLNNIGPVLIGASLIYFAFFGFDIIIELTEETKNAKETIPRAMMTGIGISTVLYCMVAVAAVSTIGWKALSTSKAPMADVAKALLGGKGGRILFLIALVSMSNTLLMGHIGSSRFIQSISDKINLPFGLGRIDKKTQTPKNAIIAVTLISILCLLLGNFEKSVSFTNIGTLLIFLLVNIIVIILRKKRPKAKRPFRVPLSIKNVPISAVIGAGSSIILGFYLLKNIIQGS